MNSMKNLLIYSIIIALAFICNCQSPPTSDSPIVRVTVKENFNQRINRGAVFQKISMVAGFEHQYDSCFLLVSNETSGGQFKLVDLQGPEFGNVALSVGPHNFAAYTNESDTISHFMEFSAHSGLSYDIKPGINDIVLTQESKQGLILIDTTGIESVPSIKAGNSIGIMSTYGPYYYSYVKGISLITFTSDGSQKQKTVPYLKEWIQTYIPATGNIRVTDSFGNVKQI